MNGFENIKIIFQVLFVNKHYCRNCDNTNHMFSGKGAPNILRKSTYNNIIGFIFMEENLTGMTNLKIILTNGLNIVFVFVTITYKT